MRVWLWQARLLWLFAAGLAVFAIVFISGQEGWTELTAFGLQFAGLSVSVYGLDKTRRDFRKPSIAALAGDWWAKRPRWRPRSDTISLSLLLTSDTRGVPPISNLMPVPTDGPLEERVAALTQNMEQISRDVYPALKTLFELSDGNQDGIASERTTRETAQKQLDKKLDLAMTDGLLISLVGLSWTALGIFLDTFGPQMLAS